MSSQQPAPNASSLVGTVVAGRYRIDALIGQGGMGAVYRAEHVHMRKVVALKVLHQHMTINDEAVRRFEREAVAAGRIEHPNVTQATDFGRLENGSFYLVLEYVAGTSLSATLERQGPFEPGRAAHVAAQVASALAAAHAEGIVHRDLKPDNVMLIPSSDGTDRVKVLDFGIAKLESGGAQLTQIGTVFGTPQYMAPEQAAGRPVDARADLYALGLILHEMLTGEPAFHSDNLLGLLTQQMTAAPPPLPPEVPEPLARLVAELLVKAPEHRLQSAAEARSTLLQGLSREQRRSLGDAPPARSADGLPPLEPAIATVTPPSTPRRQIADGSSATLSAQAATHSLHEQEETPNARSLPVALRDGARVLWAGAQTWAPMVAPRVARFLPKTLRNALEPWSVPKALVFLATLVLGATVLLTIALSAVIRTEAPVADPEASRALPPDGDDDLDVPASAEGEAPNRPDPELDRVLHLASRGSEAALYALSQRNVAERSGREWLALAQGRLIRKELSASLDAFRHAIEKQPANASSKTMLAGLRHFGSREGTCDETLEFASTYLGTHGSDLLFDVWSSTSLKTQATEKALALLQRPSQRARMSPALTLALDVRAAVKCDDYAQLLPRMVKYGDERSFRVLKPLSKETGCGPDERDDCYPCLRGSPLLTDALTQTRLRKAPRYESRRWR